MQFNRIIYIVFLILLAYFIIQFIYYLVLALIALFEEKKRMREQEVEDYPRVRASTFTLPVSVVIAAHNEEDWIKDSVQSVLLQDYPEFELIVVDDGSTDNTISVLDDFLKLKSVEKTYVEYFKFGRIREIFQSQAYPNVTVVAKTGGFKKAGALDAGLNFAKYKYVCVIDADTIIEPDGLLKVMTYVIKDPDSIIGISSYFGMVNGFKIKDGKILERSFSRNPIIACQNLEYIRSLVVNRTAWSRLNATPILSGGFCIWRRDILLDLGGFSTEFSSEDVEFTFRAQDYILENHKKGYKILTLPYIVGWTEGPSNVDSLLKQRSRWQRVVNEAMYEYRHMIFNPSHGAFAFWTLPYFLLYEVMGVFFEVGGIAVVVWAFFTGILDLDTFFAFFTLMVLSNAVISLLSLFIFVRNQKIFKPNDVAYFIILGFLEFFWYRWILILAKSLGTISWLRGKRVQDQYRRVKR